MSNMIFKGDLVTGDFLDKTMTFEIEGEMILQAGNYTILPTNMYEKLVSGADNSTKLALNLPVVIGRFCSEQQVEWEGVRYWVVEDNGGDKVLVANSKTQQHHEYNDWWVNRDELNAL